MSKTHYETLGLQRNCTQIEIKKAYKALALINHRDKTLNNSDTEMQEIVSAFEVLKDPTKRKQYDLFLDAQNETDTFQCGDPNHVSSSSTSTALVIAPILSFEKTMTSANMGRNELVALATQNITTARAVFAKISKKAAEKYAQSWWLHYNEYWDDASALLKIAMPFEEIAIKFVSDDTLMISCNLATASETAYALSLAHSAVAVIVFSHPILIKKLKFEQLVQIYNKHHSALANVNIDKETKKQLDANLAPNLLDFFLPSNNATIDPDVLYQLLIHTPDLYDLAIKHHKIIPTIIRHEKLHQKLSSTQRYLIALNSEEFALLLISNDDYLNALENDIDYSTYLGTLIDTHPSVSLLIQTKDQSLQPPISTARARINNINDSTSPDTIKADLLLANLSKNRLLGLARKNRSVAKIILDSNELREFLATNDEKKADPDCFNTRALFGIMLDHSDLALILLKQNKHHCNACYYINKSKELAIYILANAINLKYKLSADNIYKGCTTAGLPGAQLVFSDPALAEKLSGAQLFQLSKDFGLPILNHSQIQKVHAHLLLTTASKQKTGLNISKKPTAAIVQEDIKETYYLMALAYTAEAKPSLAEVYYFKAAYLGHHRALMKLIGLAGQIKSAISKLQVAEVYSNNRCELHNSKEADNWLQKAVIATNANNISAFIDHISKCINELNTENIELANLYLTTLDELAIAHKTSQLEVEKIYRTAAKTLETYDTQLALDYLEKISPTNVTSDELSHMATLANSIKHEAQTDIALDALPYPHTAELIKNALNVPAKKIERIFASLPYLFKAAAKKDARAIDRLDNIIKELFTLLLPTESDSFIIECLNKNTFILSNPNLTEKLVPFIKNETTFLQLVLLSLQAHEGAYTNVLKLLLHSWSKQSKNAEIMLKCMITVEAKTTNPISQEDFSAEKFTLEAIKLFIHKNDFQHLSFLEKILSHAHFSSMLASEFLTMLSTKDITQLQIDSFADKIERYENTLKVKTQQINELNTFWQDLNAIEFNLKQEKAICTDSKKSKLISAKIKILNDLNKDLSKDLTAYFNQDFSNAAARNTNDIKNTCIATIKKHLATPHEEMTTLSNWKIRLAFRLIRKLPKSFQESTHLTKWRQYTFTHFCVLPETSANLIKKTDKIFRIQ